MFPPEMAPQNGAEPMGHEPDSIEDINLTGAPDVDAMVSALGVAVRTNAKKSAMAVNAQEAQKYADAALKASQAIAGIVPYQEPDAPGDKQTDNAAKKGD